MARRDVASSESTDEPRRSGERRFEWELELRSSPAALWPLVADTNRFDRDSGTPSVEHLRDRDAALTNARCAVRQRLAGFTLEYEQDPFEWSYPEWFAVTRRYSRGPLARLAVEARFTPNDRGGSECRYEVRVTPRNGLGRAAIPVQIGLVYQRLFRRTFLRYDEMVQSGEWWRSSDARPRLVPGGRERLDRAVSHLGGGSAALARFLGEGDDIAVSRIRPYAFADTWSVPRREALEMFLRAAREGIVAFRWDVLCPLCGIAKASVEHLDELPRDVHCPTCNIDYEANFENSVELTFRVTPAIRKVASDEYCIGAPMATPHVVARALVPSGDAIAIEVPLEPGRHRVRCYELPGARSFAVTSAPSAATEMDVIVIDGGGWPDDEPEVGADSTLRVRNDTATEQLVIVDRTPWSDDAVSAAEVTVLQEFRDLFATEALRPGEQVSVGSLTIVFTDLRASTELYQRVGDAVAFGHVLDHFEVVRAATTSHGGSVVKTIGDAVMAVFDRPIDAVDAMLDAQAAVARIEPDGRPLGLKAGIHHGPCIAVTLNDRLDYFGTTVNFAARLEGLAREDEIVLSDEVREDPEVRDRLRADPSIRCVPSPARLKGFEVEVIAHHLGR
jgi:class 3 adenylate cyclase